MRYGKKKFQKRRFIKKRRTYRKRSSNRGRGMAWSPLGAKKLVKFRYQQEIQLDAAAGVAADYVFTANGLYQPSITAATHQPYGFDQMMENFNHYTVIGSKIKFISSSNQASKPYWQMIQLRPSATSLSGVTPSVLQEQPGTKQYLVGLGNTNFSNTVSEVFSARKFFGKKDIIGDDLYRGTTAANPSEQAYYHCMILPQAGNDLTNQVMHVIIDYVAVLTEPTTLAQS